MKTCKWPALCLIAVMAPGACPAQQKFPLQPGEWQATVSASGPSAKPKVLLYCLNDETWDKALIHNPSCSTQQLNITSSGANYVMDCQHGSLRSKGSVTIAFDGNQHMTTKDSIDTITNGQTTNAVYSVDYRWKSPTCSSSDVNLLQNKPH